MKTSKKIISLLLCVVMMMGMFSGVSIDDITSLFTIESSAYGKYTPAGFGQVPVVGVDSTSGIAGTTSRDFWYSVYANDYFNGHSEPTDIVIPGLVGLSADGSASQKYVPQGMAYWEEKNCILISAYDNEKNNASCIYVIDATTGEFVYLYYLYNTDGTVNKSHGGGIAVSDHNFYYADTGSCISYIPLYMLDFDESDYGGFKDVKLQGTIDFAAEMNGASTSYCNYDEGILWIGNFYIYNDTSYDQPAHSSYNNMMLGYRLAGNSAEEEWKYLCGQFINGIVITHPSGNLSVEGGSSGTTGIYTVYKNGQTIDIAGTVNGSCSNANSFFGAYPFDASYAYRFEFKTDTPDATMYILKADYSEVYNIRNYIASENGGYCTDASITMNGAFEQLEDGRYHCYIDLPKGVFGNEYYLRFDTGAVSGDFAITDISLAPIDSNYINAATADFNGTRCTGTVSSSIFTGEYTVSGTATRSSSSEGTNAYYNFATANLTEGETYTLTYSAADANACVYIFAPNGLYSRLPHTVTQGSDGLYYYTSTFTAGLKPVGTNDSGWPDVQSTDGSYTGTYKLRLDQNNLAVGESRAFNVTEINLKKANTDIDVNDRIHAVGYVGRPSYIIAFDGNEAEANGYDTFDRIQYAIVDDGKLYLSRSWNRNMGATTGSYLSELAIVDIDLDVPGTHSLEIGTKATKETIDSESSYTITETETRNDCYLITDDDAKHFDSLSMMESLCIVDDYLYFFTESAAYPYRQGTADNPATQPVDVVWKVDHHALLDEERPDDGNSVDLYSKVESLSEISPTGEYYIVYESDNIDPVTGNKIMYAFNSFGSYKKQYLPKNDGGTVATQANTGDSMSMIGYPISDYSVNEGFLTLNNPEEDDHTSIRWKITGAGTGSMRIENVDTYFGTYKNLTFGQRLLYMSPSTNTDLDNINIVDNGDGTFSFYYEGESGTQYYLWCNDGIYNSQYTAQYNSGYAFESPVKLYAGCVEESGTFHCDANSQSNESGNLVGNVDDKYQKFSIYRRSPNTTATGKSGLYTDLNAELQSDGTYTLTLESYTTGQTVTAEAANGKSIDFVFVIDTSSTMETTTVDSMIKSDSPAAYSYDFAGRDGSKFIKYNDNYYAMWGQTGDSKYSVNLYDESVPEDYWICLNGDLFAQGSTSDADMTKGYGLSYSNRAYIGGYYYTQQSISALTASKEAVLEFIDQIADHSELTGLEHRVAVVQYGSTSGLYTTANGITIVPYGTWYSSSNVTEYTHNAFFPVNHDNLKTIVRNIESGSSSSWAGNTAANSVDKLVANSDKTYKGDSADADCCVISLSCGPTSSTLGWEFVVGPMNVAKTNGAQIYSVKIGNNECTLPTGKSSPFGDLDLAYVFELISSNYTGGGSGSTSAATNIGTKTASTYYANVADVIDVGLDDLLGNVFNSGTENSMNSQTDVALDGNASIMTYLGENFKLTNASEANISKKALSYDVFGNVIEGDSTTVNNITANLDTSANTIKVKGFDFDQNFVTPDKDGEKLYITIKNVILNTDCGNVTVGISDDTRTAIYKDDAAVSAGTPFTYFPQEYFTVPEYTYVYDFGLDMAVDYEGGSVVSVDTVPDKQSPYQTSVSEGNLTVGVSAGKLTMSDFSPTATFATDYALVQKDDGTYEWAVVNILPASNVYFEQSEMTVTNVSGNADWSTVGGSAPSQSVSSDDVYGSDSAYDVAGNIFSNGSYWKADVTENTIRSDTAKFSYTGTGFDLVSACGKNTGIMIVTVKNSSGDVEKAYIIDTYYTDTTYVNGDGLLCQVPVIHHTNSGYDTYTVETTAVYLASMVSGRTSYALRSDGDMVDFYTADLSDEAVEAVLCFAEMEDLMGEDIEVIFADENSIFNGGTGAATSSVNTFALGAATSGTTTLSNYIDGFRVYNPLDAMTGYYPASEQQVVYYNVIEWLPILGQNPDNFAGIVYLAGESTEGITFADYQSSGPKNEVYLTPNGANGLAFAIEYSDGLSLHLGLRSADGKATTVKVNGHEFTVNSATEMYYDISDYVSGNIITIQNTGNGLLAVNNLKVCSGTVTPVSYSMLPRMRMLMALTEPEDTTVEDTENNENTTGDMAVTNPDPELDSVGEYVITYPPVKSEAETENDTSISFSEILTSIKSFFEKLIEIVTKIFSFFAEV